MSTDPAALAAILRDQASSPEPVRAVAGFDGFVDEMIEVVGERRDLEDYTAMKDMTAFADWIRGAAGRSALREIVVHRQDPGGCAVNLGDGLVHLGVDLDLFATLGAPMHPAFTDLAERSASATSWGTVHGRTLAFEFADGKIMLAAMAQLDELDPELLQQVLDDGRYASACGQARVVALTNWSLYPHMTACWRYLQEQVYRHLPNRPCFFIDLVDPSGRSREDVAAMLEVVPGFCRSGTAILGGNGNEANVVARTLGIREAADEPQAVRDQAAEIRDELDIDEVCTHCVRFAAVATREGAWAVEGPYCPSPKKSTGAGDRFNAGYLFGAALDLPPEQRLLLGNATSGFFVREARSGSVAELAAFCDTWASGKI